MFDLGVPFALWLVLAVIWIAGYFTWAYLHKRPSKDAKPDRTEMSDRG